MNSSERPTTSPPAQEGEAQRQETDTILTEAEIRAVGEQLTIIHVRFAPDGTVTEIGERPKAATPQEWFNHLSRNTQHCYQSFLGGRGVFRLSCEQIAALRQPWQTKESA